MRSARVPIARRLAGGADASMGRPWWALIWGAAAIVALSVGASWWLSTDAWERAKRDDGTVQAASAIAAGRAYLLREVEWPSVDSATGLVLSAGWPDRLFAQRFSGDHGVFRLSRDHEGEFTSDWNAEVHRHVAAGEPCGPRFRGRAVTLETVGARFQRDGDSAVVLPAEASVEIRGRSVSYSYGCVVVLDPASGERLSPVGGYPPSDLQNSAAATALLGDDGLSLWVRLVKPDGRIGWFLVVDLATGTHLAVFQVDD